MNDYFRMRIEELEAEIKKLKEEKEEIFYMLTFEDIKNKFNENNKFPTQEELECYKSLVFRKFEDDYSSEIVEFIEYRRST